MAALKDIAREWADELREGIAWVICYRSGRSWYGSAIWSDLWNEDFQTDGLNEALEILKVDPEAVALNGYYCGHFGEDMNISQLADGIRWHYENGYNKLGNYDSIQRAQKNIEEARAAAMAAVLPFSDKLTDGAEDPDPYTFDGSMTVTDFELMQKAQATREEIAAVVAAHSPHIDPELLDRITDAAAGLHIAPETMQQILDGFDKVVETVKQVAAALLKVLRPIAEWATSVARRFYEAIAAGIVPGKWLHLAKHAKKARVRKKYRSRIRRAVFTALASEGGGSS